MTKIQEAIGRLKERHPRVARYYTITVDAATPAVQWTEDAATKAAASALDGTYLLKTDRQELGDEEIWSGAVTVGVGPGLGVKWRA